MFPPIKGSDKIQGSQAKCPRGCTDNGGMGTDHVRQVGLHLLFKSSVPSVLPSIPI